MLRAASLAVAFLLPTVSVIAADLPPDISPEARAAFVKEVAPRYKVLREKYAKKVEEAKDLMKFPSTEKEGKKALQAAQSALAALDQKPWQVGGRLVLGESPKIKTGDIAIMSLVAEYVGTKVPNGVLVEGLVTANGERKVVRYLIASDFELPKAPAKGKKAPPLKLDGLWYVAGSVDVDGRATLVVYALKIKPEEVIAEAGKP